MASQQAFVEFVVDQLQEGGTGETSSDRCADH